MVSPASAAWLLIVGAAVAAVVVVSACASTGGPEASPSAVPTGGPTTTPPTPSGGPGSATRSPTPSTGGELTITFKPGSGPITTWRLTCDPPGGDHPDPVGACQALDTNGAIALPPVPKNTPCTMIYGGPEQATVTGAWRGRTISATFSRTNGCEINRWSQMVPLLPAAGA